MNLFKINKILNSIVLAIFFITVYIKIEALGSGILLAGGIVYYFLYLLFMDSSRPIISKMIISRIKRGFDDNAKKVFNYYLYYSLIISAIILIIFSIIPSTFCRVLFKDSLCTSVLMACGFLFCIHAICDVLKAYYIGNGNNKLVFFSDIVKNILLLVCTFLLIKYFYDYGLKVAALKNMPIMCGVYGATGAVFSLIISYIGVFVVLISGIGSFFKKDSFSFNEVRSKEGFRTFLKSFIPSLVKKLRTSIFPSLSFLLIAIIFIRKGYSSDSASTFDVAYSNLAYLFIPFSLLPILTAVMSKEFSVLHSFQIRAAYRKEDRKSIIYSFSNYFCAAIVVIIPTFITLITFSKTLYEKLFLLQLDNLLSIGIITGFIYLLAALDIVFCAGLEAVSLDTSYLIGNAGAFIVQMFFVFLSTKNSMTLNKIVISFLLYFLVATIIHGYFVLQDIGMRYNDVLAKLIKVCISMIPMLVIDIILANFLNMNLLIIVISIIIGYSIFGIVFTLLHGCSSKELKDLEGSFYYYYLKLLANLFHIR